MEKTALCRTFLRCQPWGMLENGDVVVGAEPTFNIPHSECKEGCVFYSYNTHRVPRAEHLNRKQHPKLDCIHIIHAHMHNAHRQNTACRPFSKQQDNFFDT